jgi:hypothetical protein
VRRVFAAVSAEDQWPRKISLRRALDDLAAELAIAPLFA